MTDKHWSQKRTTAQDEVQDSVARGFDWVLTHRREASIAGGVLLGAALIAALFAYSRSVRANEAWEKLAMAEGLAAYGRPADAQSAIDQARDAAGSPAAAALASMLEGELREAKKDPQASASFDRAQQDAPDSLKPFAAAEKVAALQLASKNAECAAAAQSFLDANADHFLAPSVQERLADCQFAAGQKEAARATWQKITLQYADTPWAQRANARMQQTK